MSYKDTERERRNPVERLALLIKLHNEEHNTNGSIWQELRQAILERDNYICWDCGGKANTVHHTTYYGITDKHLVSLCRECHMRRHSLNPELISRQTREIHDLEEAIEFSERKIEEERTTLQAYDKHWFMPYMMSRREWERHRRPYLVNQIEEIVNRLSSLKLEYEMAKAKRR